MSPRNSVSALFLANPGPLSMGTIARWLQAGHRVTSIWYPEAMRSRPSFDADRRLAKEMPFLSMHGLAEYFEFDCHPMPRLSGQERLIERVQAENADVVISVTFTDYIPKEMLSAFPGRVLNLHPSLLPAYRGPRPVLGMLWDRTIERHSGLTLHVVSERYDEGPVIAQRSVEFPASRNLGTYTGMMIDAAGALLSESTPRYLGGVLQAVAQDAESGNYCSLRASDLALRRSFTLEHVKWLCSTIGQFRHLRCDGLPDTVRVNRVTEDLGRPTGAPDRLEDLYAELDLLDARVRLGRASTTRQQQPF